jgi:hypothetical protein
MKTWLDIGFTLEKTQDGSPTLRRLQATRPDFTDGESMHHSGGAWTETLYIYKPVIEKIQNWKIEKPAYLSVGLGLGYIELLIARENLAREVKISSFEIVPGLRDNFLKWILGLELPAEIQQTYDEVGAFVTDRNPNLLKETKNYLAEAFERKNWNINGALEKATEPFQHHGIMYDAFSRAVSPELWAKEFVMGFLKDWAATPSCLSTYSCTSDLKRALKEAGYELDIRLGFKGKRHSTFAFKI